MKEKKILVSDMATGDQEAKTLILTNFKNVLYSLLVYVDELHVHGMDGGEDIGSTLDDTLPSLGHGDRSAGGEEHRLVATA